MLIHPDPVHHLRARGWTDDVDSFGVTIWSQRRAVDLVLDIGLVQGQVRFYSSYRFDVDAADMLALSMLATGTCSVVAPEAVPSLLWCPACGERHIDVGEFATKPHHTHACQSCGMTWRPAVVHTVGVRFLPGFRNEPETGEVASS
jgi:predicted RNA-binding Zn-ribbon protein involved in translation (DUF1610 family)